MEELYAHIYDMDGVAERPAYHGFSYGLLIVENAKPVCCFYVDENTDQKLQFILNHGMIEIYSVGDRSTEIYYGYVTDGEQFFCEELIYPRNNEDRGELL